MTIFVGVSFGSGIFKVEYFYMIFRAFDKQIEMIKSRAWIRGAFAAKRCISPESRVLTGDGVKAFGDISFSDELLSWDQKANQFRLSQSSASYPKTKSSGFRVVHKQGEFVVSSDHLILCSDGEYRSAQDIFEAFSLDSSDPRLSVLCPQMTIEDIDQLLFPLGDESSTHKPLDYLDHCESLTHRYDLLPHRALRDDQALSQPLCDALELSPLVDFLPYECRDVQDHMRSEYIHLCRVYGQNSSVGAQGHAAYQCVSGEAYHGSSGIYPRLYDSRRLNHQSLALCENHQNTDESSELSRRLRGVLASESRILQIERVSSRWWWDVSVVGTNNYVSEGAIHHNSGKTEGMIVDSLVHGKEQPNYINNGRDPWQAGLIEPTAEMTRKILVQKFESIAGGLIKERHIHLGRYVLDFKDGQGDRIYYLGSGDKPNRWEGGKYNYMAIDECFQQKETLFDECIARVSDSNGFLIVGGSLGTNIVNPKKTWVYRRLIEEPMDGVDIFQWCTRDNPYYPKDALDRLKNTLDPITYRQMFEISWDIVAGNRVYSEFCEDNIVENYTFNPMLRTYCSIDWGWAHPMACLFYQYNPVNDAIFVFDEIVQSKLKLDDLHARMRAKGYPISKYYCDIAGDQAREQTAVSNIRYFRDHFGIKFNYRKLKVLPSIALVRSFVCNSRGIRRLYVDRKCKHTIDGMLNYSYQEKDGQILNENPLKKDDDAVDSLRYFIGNHFDDRMRGSEWQQYKRWG